MKVSELIEILEMLDQEKEIFVEDNVTYDTEIGELGECELFSPKVIRDATSKKKFYIIVAKENK